MVGYRQRVYKLTVREVEVFRTAHPGLLSFASGIHLVWWLTFMIYNQIRERD